MSVKSRHKRWRARVAERQGLNLLYRLAVAVVGALVLAVGIVTIPYPGPGWLIVFAGLGILASEFAWAHRVLRFARTKYDAFMVWFLRQGLAVRLTGLAFTGAVVLGTMWVLGVVGLVAGWVGVDHRCLEGPFA